MGNNMDEATETGRSSGCSLVCENFAWPELGVRERKGRKISLGRAAKTKLRETCEHGKEENLRGAVRFVRVAFCPLVAVEKSSVWDRLR